MKKIYIAIRIPGFYAGIEKRMMVDQETTPVVVAIGNNQRSVVLSVCENARNIGIRPGMRVGDIGDKAVVIIEATPEKYSSEIRVVEDIILEEIPFVQYMRPGLFMAVWDGTGRFLDKPLENLLGKLKNQELKYSVGIAEEAGYAELASMKCAKNQIYKIKPENHNSFLAETPIDMVYDIPKEKIVLLKEMGIKTCYELICLPDHALVSLFGKEGVLLKVLLQTGKRVQQKLEWRRAVRIKEKISSEDEFRDKVYGLLHNDDLQQNLYHFVKTLFIVTVIYTDGKRSSGSFRLDKNIYHEGKLSELLWENIKNIWKRRVQIAEVRMRVIPGNQYTGQMDLFGSEKSSQKNIALMQSVTTLRQKWGDISVRFANNPILQHDSISAC